MQTTFGAGHYTRVVGAFIIARCLVCRVVNSMPCSFVRCVCALLCRECDALRRRAVAVAVAVAAVVVAIPVTVAVVAQRDDSARSLALCSAWTW